MSDKTPAIPDRYARAQSRIRLADVRRLWADKALTRARIAEQLGVSESKLKRLARAMNLPSRTGISRPCIHDRTLFSEMWRAGVTQPDMASYFGVSVRTIYTTGERFGLPKRGPGGWAAPSLAMFFLTRAANESRDAMARHQAKEFHG